VQVGASNELPESEELEALYDRFLVRREVRQVSAANLNALLRTTDTAIAARASGDPASPASASETLVNHEDFTSVRCAAAATFSRLLVENHLGHSCQAGGRNLHLRVPVHTSGSLSMCLELVSIHEMLKGELLASSACFTFALGWRRSGA